MSYGIIPLEPPIINSTEGQAPRFIAACDRLEARLVAKGWKPIKRETLRTDARQAWLYDFGRDYDDGRGIVTFAKTAKYGWHFFGLATDYGDERYDEGSEPAQFWTDLEEAALSEGMESGACWKMDDKPHVQFGGIKATPSDVARQLYATGGNPAVWAAVGAT